jgi:TrmH family RNA methyltransferase
MTEKINSASNPRIRNLQLLQSRSSERRKQGRIVIEGFREIERALLSGIMAQELYVCVALDQQGRARELVKSFRIGELVEVSETAFAKVAYRESSDGLIALAIPVARKLDDLELPPDPLLLVIEAVEKPGNLGAVMRTADAAGVDAVIVCDPLTDIYNPNAIRSSVGCVFTKPIVTCTTAQAIDFFTNKGITSFAAALTPGAVEYTSADYRKGSAIVLGTEATGLSGEWLRAAGRQVIIPMLGIADSLNVSTSAAILVFEAVRQRRSG